MSAGKDHASTAADPLEAAHPFFATPLARRLVMLITAEGRDS
jgi:hypothetical protein